MTTAQGAYSALPLCFGLLSVAAPAIVLSNQNYDFLIGTAFVKQFKVNICHENQSFLILGQTIPLLYSADNNNHYSKSINLVKSEDDKAFSSPLSHTYSGLLVQEFKNVRILK